MYEDFSMYCTTNIKLEILWKDMIIAEIKTMCLVRIAQEEISK